MNGSFAGFGIEVPWSGGSTILTVEMVRNNSRISSTTTSLERNPAPNRILMGTKGARCRYEENVTIWLIRGSLDRTVRWTSGSLIPPKESKRARQREAQGFESNILGLKKKPLYLDKLKPMYVAGMGIV
jgi:hypothetical protein